MVTGTVVNWESSMKKLNSILLNSNSIFLETATDEDGCYT